MGLLPGPAEIHQKQPQRIDLPGARLGQKVIKIASGENHFLMLTEGGFVYSVGVPDVGQLGRRHLSLRSNTQDPKGQYYVYLPDYSIAAVVYCVLSSIQ